MATKELETRLEKAVNEEAKNVSEIYGISYIRAQIIIMKGVTIYQDHVLQNPHPYEWEKKKEEK